MTLRQLQKILQSKLKPGKKGKSVLRNRERSRIIQKREGTYCSPPILIRSEAVKTQFRQDSVDIFYDWNVSTEKRVRNTRKLTDSFYNVIELRNAPKFSTVRGSGKSYSGGQSGGMDEGRGSGCPNRTEWKGIEWKRQER